MRNLLRVLILASVAIYLTMALWSFPLIAENAGGLEGFDLRFEGYSAEQGRAFLTALSDTGRAHYLGIQHQIDLVYPAILSLTLILCMLRFGARLPVILRLLMVLIPLGAGVVDYIENALVAEMLMMPVAEVTDAMITQASLVTLAKFGLYGASGILVLILGLAFAVRRRRNIRRRRAREAKL